MKAGKELLQKQWDNWSNEQFVYMKKWAEDVADEIIFSFCGKDYKMFEELRKGRYKWFMQSAIMKSMLKR